MTVGPCSSPASRPKSPEAATEMTICWTGDVTCPKQHPAATPHCGWRWQAGHGSSFHYSRGGGGYQLQGELASGGLLSYQANEQLGQGQAHR